MSRKTPRFLGGRIWISKEGLAERVHPLLGSLDSPRQAGRLRERSRKGYGNVLENQNVLGATRRPIWVRQQGFRKSVLEGVREASRKGSREMSRKGSRKCPGNPRNQVWGNVPENGFYAVQRNVPENGYYGVAAKPQKGGGFQ